MNNRYFRVLLKLSGVHFFGAWVSGGSLLESGVLTTEELGVKMKEIELKSNKSEKNS